MSQQVYRYLFTKSLNSNSIRYLSTQSEPLYMQYTPVHRVIEKKQTPLEKPILPSSKTSDASLKNQKSKTTAVKNDLPAHQVRSSSSNYLVVDDA